MLRRAASAAANRASTATAVCAPAGTTSRQERYTRTSTYPYVRVYSYSRIFLMLAILLLLVLSYSYDVAVIQLVHSLQVTCPTGWLPMQLNVSRAGADSKNTPHGPSSVLMLPSCYILSDEGLLLTWVQLHPKCIELGARCSTPRTISTRRGSLIGSNVCPTTHTCRQHSSQIIRF